MISTNQYTYSNGDRESSASALLSSTIALKSYDKILHQDTYLRKYNSPLNRVQNNPSRKIADPTVGRPAGRPTPCAGRPGSRPGAQQRVGSLQSVDRVPASADGRPPGRLCSCWKHCCCFSAAEFSSLLPSSTSSTTSSPNSFDI